MKPVTKGIRDINLWMAQHMRSHAGNWLCSACRKKSHPNDPISIPQLQSLSSSLIEEDVSTSWNGGSGDSDSDGWVRTNKSSLLVSLGQSPIDQTKTCRKRYCEDKVMGVRNSDVMFILFANP